MATSANRLDVRYLLGPDGLDVVLLPDAVLDRVWSSAGGNTAAAAIRACDWLIAAAAQSTPVSVDGQTFDFSKRIDNWRRVKSELQASHGIGTITVAHPGGTTANEWSISG